MNSTIECRKCHSKNSINATLCYNCDESLQNYNYYKNTIPRPWGNRIQNKISKSEYEQQKARYIGRCDIYMSGSIKPNAGIIGKRRAVVESKGSEEWSSENHDYYTDSYSYGELYVLVIARQ